MGKRWDLVDVTAQHSSRTESDRHAWRWAVVRWLAAALAVLTLASLWHWQSERDAADLLRLPESERAALYQQAMATLRGVCLRERRATLADYCAHEADLVLRLPECDLACQHFVRFHYSKPTR